ncbi:MAG: hypothetical protein ACRDHW_14545 [Ktedonobacteraceae bacterium]
MTEQQAMYNYSDLRDDATDDQHDYHARYIESHYKACATCGKETNELCVLCKKAGCDKCLYNLRLRELAGTTDDDLEFGRVCLGCYQAHEQHAPYSWGWYNYRYISWSAPAGADIEKGFSSPAGDLHSWVSDPTPAEVIHLHHQTNSRLNALDVFALRSLMAWLHAWEPQVNEIAQRASTRLVDYHNRMLVAARRADAGHIDYSQYE